MTFVFFALLMGVSLAILAAANARLAGFMRSPLLASAFSFGVGTAFLACATSLGGHSLLFDSSLFSSEPFWIWLGGALGAVGLTLTIFAFINLGAIETAIIPILGQIVASVTIDHFGLFNLTQKPLTALIALGMTLVFAGIFTSTALSKILSKGASQANLSNYASKIWTWRILAAVAGAAMAVQMAVNAGLGKALGSPIHASFISFFTGWTILIIIAAALKQNFKNLKEAFGKGRPWWIYIGGVLGGSFVLGGTFLAPRIGTGEVVVIALVGQILASIAIDQFGLLGALKKPIGILKIMGLAIMIAGVTLVKF